MTSEEGEGQPWGEQTSFLDQSDLMSFTVVEPKKEACKELAKEEAAWKMPESQGNPEHYEHAEGTVSEVSRHFGFSDDLDNDFGLPSKQPLGTAMASMAAGATNRATGMPRAPMAAGTAGTGLRLGDTERLGPKRNIKSKRRFRPWWRLRWMVPIPRLMPVVDV